MISVRKKVSGQIEVQILNMVKYCLDYQTRTQVWINLRQQINIQLRRIYLDFSQIKNL